MLIASKCPHCEKMFYTEAKTFPEEVDCLYCERPTNTLRLLASGDARLVYDSNDTKNPEAEDSKLEG
jgi:hypothetical protein